MEQRLSIITLGVDDLKASEAFYSGLLGWKKDEAFSNDSITFYPLNGIYLALFGKNALADDANATPNGKGFPGFSIAYNTRNKEEVDQLFEQLKAYKTHIQKMPEAVFWGGYSGYLKDPDGYLIEVAFNPFIKLDENGNLS